MKNILLVLLLSLNFSNFEVKKRNYFDPQQVAKEEVAAWKDYYNNDISGLVQHLSQLVIMEFRLNQLSAWKTVIPELVAAASIFKNLPNTTSRDTYENDVLPHLQNAYEAIREALQASWDAHQAAQYELDWWIYRRQQKNANPEIVGKIIADLYRLIYGKDHENHFARAGYLRAVAARYRDLSQTTWKHIEEEDWQIIENILEQSYKELLAGIKQRT